VNILDRPVSEYDTTEAEYRESLDNWNRKIALYKIDPRKQHKLERAYELRFAFERILALFSDSATLKDFQDAWYAGELPKRLYPKYKALLAEKVKCQE
jgi:hypothetical protein